MCYDTPAKGDRRVAHDRREGGDTMALADTAWRLETFEGDASAPALDGVEVTLEFQRDAGGGLRMGGKSGCNRYTAGVTVSGDTLSLSPIAGTRMMCPEPQMAVEDAYLKALGSVSRYEEQADRLVLFHADGELRFSPAS
jgi:heat shock protein HslJ